MKNREQKLKDAGLIPENEDEEFDFDLFASKVRKLSAEQSNEGDDDEVLLDDEDDEDGDDEVHFEGEDEEEEAKSAKNKETNGNSEETLRDKETDESVEKKSKDRGSKRIQSLIAKNRELQEAHAALLQKLESSSVSTKQSEALVTQARIDAIEASINLKRRELEEARTNGTDTSEIEDALMDLRIDLKVEKSRKANFDSGSAEKEARKEPSNRVNSQKVEIPPAAVSFVKENPWITNPQSLSERKLREYTRQLAAEFEHTYGYDMGDPATYAELKTEIAEYAKTNGLQVDGVFTPQKSVKQEKSPSSSSARTSSSKKNRIVITKEEKDYLENTLGITSREDQIRWAKMRDIRDKQKENFGSWRSYD